MKNKIIIINSSARNCSVNFLIFDLFLRIHLEYFKNNKLTIRVEMIAGIVLLRNSRNDYF